MVDKELYISRKLSQKAFMYPYMIMMQIIVLLAQMSHFKWFKEHSEVLTKIYIMW